jgi:hypothetical protein
VVVAVRFVADEKDWNKQEYKRVSGLKFFSCGRQQGLSGMEKKYRSEATRATRKDVTESGIIIASFSEIDRPCVVVLFAGAGGGESEIVDCDDDVGDGGSGSGGGGDEYGEKFCLGTDEDKDEDDEGDDVDVL